MDNHILENNLKTLSVKNPVLAQKIAEISELKNEIFLEQNENGQFNMVFNQILVHENTNPETEAKNILQSVASNDLNSTHVMLGMGLGYLFSEFCDNAKGKIIVFEPELEILRSTLEVVDFTKELARSDVYIVDNIEDFKAAYTFNYSIGIKTNFVFLNFYKFTFKDAFEYLLNETQVIQTLCHAHVSLQRARGVRFFVETFAKLSTKISMPPLTTLQDSFNGKPALIVSAGPSLSKNIEIIKKYRDKVVVFCVGSAYKVLEQHGIRPDFLNIIEMKNSSSQVSGSDVSDINFICEAYTNRNFHNFEFKRKFMTYSKENPANIWFSDLIGLDCSECETKGTVSYNALYSAKLLGCNPIILIGQDLAYSSGNCYSKDSIYSDFKYVKDETDGNYKFSVGDFESFAKKYFAASVDFEGKKEQLFDIIQQKLDRMNKEVVMVPGLSGEQIPTSMEYALFIQYFRDFALRNNDSRRLVNSSEGGALIEGFEFVKLEEILSTFNESLNVEEILAQRDDTYKPNLTEIIAKLSAEINVLKNAIPIFEREQKNVMNFQRELKRYRQLTPEVHKYLKKCMDAFIDLLNNYQTKSKVFEMATYVEKSDLGFILKAKDQQYDYETQNEIGEALHKYFYDAHAKVVKIVSLLDNRLKEIKDLNESADSESENSLCNC